MTPPKPDPDAEQRPNAAAAAKDAAEAAADSGATPASARSAASAAATAAGLADADADKLADRMVDRMEARGLFDVAPAGEPGESVTPTPAPVEVPPEPPRKLSFAERFAGRK